MNLFGKGFPGLSLTISRDVVYSSRAAAPTFTPGEEQTVESPRSLVDEIEKVRLTGESHQQDTGEMVDLEEFLEFLADQTLCGVQGAGPNRTTPPSSVSPPSSSAPTPSSTSSPAPSPPTGVVIKKVSPVSRARATVESLSHHYTLALYATVPANPSQRETIEKHLDQFFHELLGSPLRLYLAQHSKADGVASAPTPAKKRGPRGVRTRSIAIQGQSCEDLPPASFPPWEDPNIGPLQQALWEYVGDYTIDCRTYRRDTTPQNQRQHPREKRSRVRAWVRDLDTALHDFVNWNPQFGGTEDFQRLMRRWPDRFTWGAIVESQIEDANVAEWEKLGL